MNILVLAQETQSLVVLFALVVSALCTPGKMLSLSVIGGAFSIHHTSVFLFSTVVKAVMN